MIESDSVTAEQRILVLIVVDEAIGGTLKPRLVGAGYEVERLSRGDDAEARLQAGDIDLLIIDRTLPGLTGLAICRRARARPELADLPIILLGCETGEQDRVEALDGGADDFVAKPFSTAELMARIHAVLRRAGKPLPNQVEIVGTITINRTSRRVSRRGREIVLAPLEFSLLSFLMQRPGQVFTRAQLIDGVWPRGESAGDRAVDARLKRLRRALSRQGEADPILAVRGEGYAFDQMFEQRW